MCRHRSKPRTFSSPILNYSVLNQDPDGHDLLGTRLALLLLFVSAVIVLLNLDGLVRSRFTDDFVKSSKFKARESRVTRRTDRTPQ